MYSQLCISQELECGVSLLKYGWKKEKLLPMAHGIGKSMRCRPCLSLVSFTHIGRQFVSLVSEEELQSHVFLTLLVLSAAISSPCHPAVPSRCTPSRGYATPWKSTPRHPFPSRRFMMNTSECHTYGFSQCSVLRHWLCRSGSPTGAVDMWWTMLLYLRMQ